MIARRGVFTGVGDGMHRPDEQLEAECLRLKNEIADLNAQLIQARGKPDCRDTRAGETDRPPALWKKASPARQLPQNDLPNRYLSAALADLTYQVEDLKSSLSWRLTAPLRYVGRIALTLTKKHPH